MYQEITGSLDGAGHKFAIVVARFNKNITEKLLKGSLDTLDKQGVAPADVTIYWVPGAWEIPLTAKKLAETGNFDAVICLGAIIKGETVHFDYVAGESAAGITRTGLDTGIPIIAGIVTTHSLKMAEARCGIRGPNIGEFSANAALEMANLYQTLKQVKSH